MIPLPRRVALPLSILVALTLGGCFNPFSPRIDTDRGVSSPPPVPNSPTKVIELFDWCWDNRAYQEYTEIFTDDFRFQFSARDSAGTTGRGEFLTRTEELDIAKNLFVEGTAAEPPAQSITLDLDPGLIAFPDSRPGKDSTWHKEISTSVTLQIQAGEQDFRVMGRVRFFVVRGDSAAIPLELAGRFRPDPNRWWIERWEDETEGEADHAGARPRVEGAVVPVSFHFGSARRGPAVAPASGARANAEYTWSWTRFKLVWLPRR